MDGNFKTLVLFMLCIICFSCKNDKTKAKLGGELVTENLSVLLDDIDYFNVSNDTLSVGIYPYIGEIKSDQRLVIENFQKKFNLNGEKIFSEPIKIEKIPKKIRDYSLFLETDNSFKKRNNVVQVSFVNLIISNNSKYAVIEVTKSLGNGAKFELYYFKRVNGKWVFEGKEIISLG